jgi:hypothetical protein
MKPVPNMKVNFAQDHSLAPTFYNEHCNFLSLSFHLALPNWFDQLILLRGRNHLMTKLIY